MKNTKNAITLTKNKRIIPTYIPGAPSGLPMFFENKPYQGASGRLYPIPYSDKISDEKSNVEYTVYTLENEYVKTEVLPEIGGKILRGLDKTSDYDFIYYNEVVKPALVGLAGPWISGGIEFNFPQHHRPTTFLPLEATTEAGENGSQTVWTGEVEPFGRLKGMAGITLDPGRSYIKAKIKVYNRTAQRQRFMWWANLAVPVNESYRTIFPPDVEWVNDHDRRCVMSWSIAKGVYHTARPFDYGEGTDISKYSAVKVPSSFLVSQGQSDMDFVAGYDGSKNLGIATVADHHISPGKKMWHWGKGDFDDMWCSNLTDENGPYIELMTGVYTDNQPDFTWLEPYESREFEQYWYPIREIGDVKNASIDAALNVEKRTDRLFLGFNVTGSFDGAEIVVHDGEKTIFTDTSDMSPDKAYTKEIPFDGEIGNITVSLRDSHGKILVEYKTYKRGSKNPITPRPPVKRPSEIPTVEELYINGLHLEQYKQHNYNPQDYYLEGLHRDSADIRCNTSMARISLSNARFDDCINYADKAIERLTSRNMHPIDTEALYLKGIALMFKGKYKSAEDALAMAAWNYATKSAAELAMGQINCLYGKLEAALVNFEASVSLNKGNHKAKVLAAAGKTAEAKKAYLDGINMPKFYGEAKTFFNQEAHIYYYLGLLTNDTADFEKAAEYKATVSEISLFRALALRKLGKFSQAKAVLEEMLENAENTLANVDRRSYYGVGSPSPMPFETDIVKSNTVNASLLKAYALLGLGRFHEAEQTMKTAEALDKYDYRCFAYRCIENTVR